MRCRHVWDTVSNYYGPTTCELCGVRANDDPDHTDPRMGNIHDWSTSDDGLTQTCDDCHASRPAED